MGLNDGEEGKARKKEKGDEILRLSNSIFRIFLIKRDPKDLSVLFSFLFW